MANINLKTRHFIKPVTKFDEKFLKGEKVHKMTHKYLKIKENHNLSFNEIAFKDIKADLHIY